jgi:hypothetical protein
MLNKQQTNQSVLALDKELKATAAYHVVKEIRGFSRSIKLFEGNYQQLADSLEYFSDAERSFELEQAGHEKLKVHFQSEVVRLIHNFVAAALSLVDHTRIHYRKLYGEGEFPEYRDRLGEAFADDQLANFVKGLRQYFQHFGLPHIYFETAWSRDNPIFLRTVRLRNRELQDFDWKQKAREFLLSQSEDIDLFLLVKTYHEKVVQFYEWFQGRQEEIHADQFAEVAEKQMQIRRIALPDILNGLLQMPDINAEMFETNVIKFLDEDELVMYALMESNSKAEFLLLVFKQMAEISTSIEKRIRALWKKTKK